MSRCLCSLFIGFLVALLPAHAFAQDSGGIRIVYAADWAPISHGEGSDVRGILPDLMEAIIARRLGVPVIHSGQPWGRAQALIESGQADAFVTTPTEARLEYARRSEENVLLVPFQAFTTSDSTFYRELAAGAPLTSLKDARFCDVLGNGWAKAFYAKRKLDYLSVPTIENCLKLLSVKRSDVIVHAAPVTRLYIQHLDLAELVSQLPHIYPESPAFPLLISRKSSFGPRFLASFDRTIGELRASGEFDRMMSEIQQANLEASVSH